ncbi:MAG: [FeFe] hydrogenase H-cluster radical SAM maturase HydG [Pseudomonadota bacterium]
MNNKKIENLVNAKRTPDQADVAIIIKKSLQKKGLSLEEAAALINVTDPELIQEIFQAAAQIKKEIYGDRLVLFAPLYISNFCQNNCAYCNYRADNQEIVRRSLTKKQIQKETECLLKMGHKRLLLEFGEDLDNFSVDQICHAIETIYATETSQGNIRRINVNIAATTLENYKKLKTANIGTYQLFQETFHQPTYEKLHKGPKADFQRQLSAHKLAFAAGLDDLGIGVLFGLYDWRFEVLALLEYAKWMDQELGVGPHTISVPRFQKAPHVSFKPTYSVSDQDFLKIIAILRMAVPYTGMILSTRESIKMRSQAFKLGISQASAASITTPGGYAQAKAKKIDSGQFKIQDQRSLEQVIQAAISDGLIPSFCTACYRSKRTGENFMELARHGQIHEYCLPNALLTFAEYLEDSALQDLQTKGWQLIQKQLSLISNDKLRSKTHTRLAELKQGKRDLFF